MKSWVSVLGETSGFSPGNPRGETIGSPAITSNGIVRLRSWSEGLRVGALTLGLLGEALSVILATREVIARVSLTRGVAESSGILGVNVIPAGESFCDRVSHSPLKAAVLSAHGSGSETSRTGVSREDSLIAKELKLMFEVSVVVGLSCDGQEGKLADVLGQIIAMKHGKDVGGVRANHNLMKHKILSWNVRGLNGGNKRLRVRNLLSQWKVDIVCLQESKLELIMNSLVQSLWRCPYVEWCHVASNGASGGILIMWDRRVVSKLEVCLGSFVATCSFRNVDDGLVWAFVGVYGSNRGNLRRLLWEELAGLMSLWEMPWCIGGDFNVTLYHSEGSGGARTRRAVTAFTEFTADQGHMNLPLSGRVSTWSNKLSWFGLDRFLVYPEWELSYPSLVQKKLLHVCSNHTPILLAMGCMQYGKRSFKFENMWLKEEEFVENVRNWWGSFSFVGSPSFVLAKKLRALKGEITRWNFEVFGNVRARNKAWVEELEMLDSTEEGRGLSEEEKERRRVLATDLEASLLQQEISYRQKSRVWWLKEGDKCTKFFHQVANANQRNNYIESPTVNVLTASDPAIISDHIVNFYESLFLEPLS